MKEQQTKAYEQVVAELNRGADSTLLAEINEDFSALVGLKVACEEDTLVVRRSNRNGEPVVQSPTTLSAGEGSILSILCDVALAPIGGLVVIDEPEMHLEQSKSVMLCQILEERRPDLFFVYITHQPEIAARPGTAVYAHVTEDQMMMKLTAKLLSKPERHVLFFANNLGADKDDNPPPAATERPSPPLSKQVFVPLFRDHFTLRSVDKTSHDHDLIEVTKRTRAQLAGLDGTEVAGLVDRANHSAEYIDMMRSKHIHHLQVCEAENLLWTPEVLRLVCVSIGLVTASESALASSSSSSPPSAITGLEGMEAVCEFFAELFASLREEKDDGKGKSTARSIYDEMINAITERWTTYLQRQTESEWKDNDKTLKDAKGKAKQQKGKEKLVPAAADDKMPEDAKGKAKQKGKEKLVPAATASNDDDDDDDDDAQPATAAAAGASSKPAEPPVLRYFRQALPTGSHLHAAAPTRETVATIIRRYITELRGKMVLKDYKTDEWADLAKKQQIEVKETLKKITELNVDEPDEPDFFYGSLRLWAKELVDDIVERGDVERALEHLSHHGVVGKLNEFVRKKKGGASSTFDIRKTVERLLQTNEDMRQAMLLRVPPQLLAIMHAADKLRGARPVPSATRLGPLYFPRDQTGQD